MNFNFYIFGTPGGQYNQYPDDYTSSLLKNIHEGITGSKLVILREYDLIHYIFIEKLQGDDYLGLCLIFNKVCSNHPSKLLELFKLAIEDFLIKEGKIIKYNTSGDLVYVNTSFSKNVKAINDIKDFINGQLINEANKFSFKEVSDEYNGSKIKGFAKSSLSDKEIVELTKKHNLLIIDDKSGVSDSYIASVINSLKSKIESGEQTIARLSEELSKVRKQKKQMSVVLVLCIIIIAGAFVFTSLIQDRDKIISNANKKIETLTEVCAVRKDSISLLSNNYNNLYSRHLKLDTDYSALKLEYNEFKEESEDKYATLERDYNSYKQKTQNTINDNKEEISSLKAEVNALSSLKSTFPINITSIEIANVDYDGDVYTNYGNTIYSSSTMYLKPKIRYTGISSGKSITLKTRWYLPDGSMRTGSSSPSGYCQSENLYIYSGYNSHTLSGWGSSTKGNWKRGKHRIEIWYDDICLKSHTFTIY